jgi:GrpB-like predicted nucleotidyltransferase (UPF0157 family)/predicted kinase
VKHQPVIYLITGPMAAGKSTVARLLASRLERGVYLEGDVFRRNIASGREEMTPTASSQAVEQLQLRYRLAAGAADGYFEAGFSVALEDVVAGPILRDWRMMLRNRPCHVIVLLPSVEAILAREAERSQNRYSGWTVEQLYDRFASDTPRVGLWLDTTNLTPDETVEEIVAQTGSTRTPIVIKDYDADWPLHFEEIAQPVRDATADLGSTVEHIGSTSVPGLAAKPVIDIDVAVASPNDVPTAIERLRSLGYLYQGDKGIKGREAFMWPSGARPHHLYVVVQGNESHRKHIAFRNYLRDHPEVARDYAALKTRLAEQHGDDRLGYTDAKTEFVSRALREARA